MFVSSCSCEGGGGERRVQMIGSPPQGGVTSNRDINTLEILLIHHKNQIIAKCYRLLLTR